MANQVFLGLPTPVIDIIGWENTASISGGVVFALPVLAMQTGDIEGLRLELPAPALVIDGMTGAVTIAQQPMALPLPVISVAGTPGVIGAVQLSMPMLSMLAQDPDATTLALPALVLAITATTGVVGDVRLVMPAATLSAVGAIPFVADVALSLTPRIAIVGAVGVAGGVSLTLRSLALAIGGYTGAVGNASMVLPVMRLSASGYGPHLGNIVLSLPVLALQITGQQAAGAAFTTMAMHTENMALTEYTNYPFNSFAQFNGVYLGAKDDGIFALTGATDDGALIDAAARLGVTDFGTSHLKRVDRCYVGYRADGNLVLRVTTDETQVRDYLLTATGKAGMHGNHVRVGKGLAARYWQFEIRNKDGADFDLDVMEIKPTPLRRRIGGNDG